VVEKMIMGNVKTHFLDHLSDDIKRLVRHAKKNFKNFSLVKKMMTVFVFLGSLGFIGKFMGGMLAVKVFVAKVWSFLLALFLKVGTAVTYFFTDYLWGSWLAPLVEVVIFTWLLSWMEKVPFLARGLREIYAFFVFWFGWMEYYVEKVFHIPLKGFLKWLVKKIQNSIYHFIGVERVSAWKRLKQRRMLNPNTYTQILEKRNKRMQGKKEGTYFSPRDVVLQGRKTKSR
jgi:Zn-dependent protease with chaperone function